MPFNLSHQAAFFSHLNTRAENAGDDKQPAADLKFRVNVPQARLEDFGDGLSKFLFYKKGVGGDLVNQIADAPDLRFPRLGGYAYSGEIVGADVTIHYGLQGNSDVVLAGAKVNKFVIEPMEGGTCVVIFRVQAHPTDAQIGRIYALMGRNTEISLKGPEFVDDVKNDEGTE